MQLMAISRFGRVAGDSFWCLSQPEIAIGAVLVVVISLFLDIESAVTRVVANTRSIRPVAPVTMHIVVHQKALKVSSSNAPILLQLFRPKASDILPPSITHISSQEQLQHVRIDQLVLCPALDPLLEHLRVP